MKGCFVNAIKTCSNGNNKTPGRVVTHFWDSMVKKTPCANKGNKRRNQINSKAAKGVQRQQQP